jgi:hypothetical protein
MTPGSTTAEPSKHHELGSKFKLPFRELKDKLNHNNHFTNAKIHLAHQK